MRHSLSRFWGSKTLASSEDDQAGKGIASKALMSRISFSTGSLSVDCGLKGNRWWVGRQGRLVLWTDNVSEDKSILGEYCQLRPGTTPWLRSLSPRTAATHIVLRRLDTALVVWYEEGSEFERYSKGGKGCIMIMPLVLCLIMKFTVCEHSVADITLSGPFLIHENWTENPLDWLSF